jgi:hypothetical protein
MNSSKVSEQIWCWKASPVSGQPHSRPALRAVIQAAVAGGIGWLFLWRGHKGMAWFLASVAAFLFLSGLFIPRLFLDFERFGRKFGQWVGGALTWLALTPTFFLVFFPGRLILWLTKHDPMRRQFPSKEETFWTPRPPVKKIEQYSRQY